MSPTEARSPLPTRPTHGLVTLALTSIAALTLHPAPSGAARDHFAETIEVVTVEVPVNVVAGGRAVRGLTADNFEVYAGKKRQDVISFDVVDLGMTPAIESTDQPASGSAPALPVAARRHFLLLFDLSFSQPDGIVKARSAAYELVDRGLHPSDLVALATYTLNRGPKLLLSFTSDREQLVRALHDLGLQQYSQRVADPLGLVADLNPLNRSSADTAFTDGGGGGNGPNINGSSEWRQHLADLSIATARVAREQQIDRVRSFSGSFEELGSMLRSVRGRKQVVLFSEGFDTSAILGTDSANRAAETARAAELGEYWKVDSDERFGSTSTLGFLDEMLETFRRADAVIQAVDVGGARTDARSESAVATSGLLDATGTPGLASRSENSLFVMANETGGELYRNFNDLDDAMGQLLERTSVTYVLSFNPKQFSQDGDFQSLEIKLKDAPRGARALHRPGFFMPTPFLERSALDRQLEVADLVMDGADGGDIEFTAWAVPGLVLDNRREVMIFLDIDGPSMLSIQEFDEARFRVFAYALDAKGTVGDFMTQALTLDLDRVEKPIMGGGLVFFGKLRLPPGAFRLRAIVQDARSGRHGAVTAHFTVPEPTSTAPSLAPPLFALAPGEGLLLVENDSRDLAMEYPLSASETAFVPRSVLRPAGARIAVLVAAYARPDAVLDAWLEDASGQPVETRVETAERLAPADDDTLRARLMVDTTGLADGDYRLRLRLAEGEASRSTSARLIVGDG